MSESSASSAPRRVERLSQERRILAAIDHLGGRMCTGRYRKTTCIEAHDDTSTWCEGCRLNDAADLLESLLDGHRDAQEGTTPR